MATKGVILEYCVSDFPNKQTLINNYLMYGVKKQYGENHPKGVIKDFTYNANGKMMGKISYTWNQ